MKKFFVVLLLIIIALIIAFFIRGFLQSWPLTPISSSVPHPPQPDAAHAPIVIRNGTKYFTLNGEFSIIIPSEYRVSTQYGILGKQTLPPEAGQQIFIATSSDTLIAMRKEPGQYSKDFTQKEAVYALYKLGNLLNQNNPPGESFGPLNEIQLGGNYYGVRDGTIPRIRTDNGKEIIQNVRQYITYYNQATYYIEFNDYAPNSINPSSTDQIVSTINFN